MKSRLLPPLALAAVLALSACSGEPGTSPAPRTEAAPADTSVLPPQTAEPSPDASTTPPGGAVTPANLPEADDLEWNEGTSWRAGATSVGGGSEQLSVCQQNSIESLGANAIHVRRFSMTGDGEAVSIAMSFENEELAGQAYATAQDWFAACEPVLVAQQRTDGRQGIPETAVEVPDGRAQVTEWGYRSATTDPDSLEFESQGLVQLSDRVSLTVMRIEGQDNNWDLEPGGPVGAVHPMIRSLPAVATKLAR